MVCVLGKLEENEVYVKVGMVYRRNNIEKDSSENDEKKED